VIRQIAVGGMAELYLARTVGMEGFEKLVCVKRILPQYVGNPRFVNLFLNEARLAATLHHPNIAQVYDIGQEQGEFFFAMEYVHGEDLGRLVASARESGVPVSLDCALTLVSGLCAGLHHAHEKASPEGKPLGVVHRDVSPTNVLVSYDGAVKLVDFGIARASGEPASSVTGLKGKVSYMSPEQCRGNVALDRRSDVFSIGAILYELTTGRLPFIDETEYGVLQQIVNRDADPPSTLVPGYPPALDAIVMRALSRDVTRRFSTALELQNQLEDFAHDNRLRVSPLVLARLMSTLFPARLEEWDHARAQGAFFVEQHVVRTLIESGKAPVVPSPAMDDEATALAEAPTVPAGRGSTPSIPPGVPGAPGSMPRLSTPPPIATSPGVGMPMVAPGGSMPGVPAESPGAYAAAVTGAPPSGPGNLPRLSTPPPVATMPGSGVPAGAPMSQPRLPTPPPMPGQQPLPGVRYAMPVPNNPGAVPIVTPPMMMPPAGGTLVSSALQAASPSSTLPPPFASAGTLVSSGLQAGTPMSTLPPGAGPGMSMPGMASPGMGMSVPPVAASYSVPAAAVTFDPVRTPVSGGYGGFGPSGGFVDQARISGGHPVQTLQDAAGELPQGSNRANARTMMLRPKRRSWLPIGAIIGAGAIGAVVLAVVLGTGDATTPAVNEAASPTSDTAAGAKSEPTPTGNAKGESAAVPAAPAGTPEAKTGAGAASPTAAGNAASGTTGGGAAAVNAASEPAGAASGSTSSDAAAASGNTASGTPAGTTGGAASEGTASGTTGTKAGTARSALGASAALPTSEQDGAHKRTVKGATDPHKPSRSRVRSDSRRADPRRKPDAKEQTWNDESPFMPVQTPKR
jgi:serine/threonine-protein kinase